MKRDYGTIKNFKAGGAIGKYRIIKFGADDDTVVLSAAGTDLLLGISSEIDASSGERLDVVLDGIGPVIYGGNVTRGAFLTSDANGAAVAAISGDRTIGVALVSGVSGDIGSVLISHAKN